MNKTPILLPASLLALAGCSGQKNGQEMPRPNVLLIVADDLGLGDVSCYGSTTIKTPNLDSLASQGVLFNHAYATSATSTPSRYAMFTGMYPWRANMAILPGDAPLVIPEDMPTMPKMFQDCGYSTAAIGKWHLGMGAGDTNWNEQLTPAANTVGFNYTNLIPATVDRVPCVYVENGKVVNLDPNDPISINYGDTKYPGEITGRDNPGQMKMKFHHGHDGTIINGIPRIGHMKGGKAALWDDTTMAEYFLSKAKAFVDTVQSPFFLYYGLHEPHVPRVPAKEFEGATKYGPRGDVIVEADYLVGEIVRYLDKKGLLDNTIVIFTSDNGAVVQDGYIDHSDELLADHDPHGGLRGGKYSLFDGGTHIPFFVYWKGHLQPSVSDAYICQIDFYASFAKMLGVKAPKGLDSEEHLETFLGKSPEGRKMQILEAAGRLAIRKDNYVLIPPYHGKATNATGNELGNLSDFGLYNIENDRHQDVNIAAENPELVSKISAEMSKTIEGYTLPGGDKLVLH